MKRLMWILAVIPVVVTGIVLQYLPDEIPLHYDIEGNVDSYGSRGASFVLPVMILLITAFWHLMIRGYEKTAINGKTEKKTIRGKIRSKAIVSCRNINGCNVWYYALLHIIFVISFCKFRGGTYD